MPECMGSIEEACRRMRVATQSQNSLTVETRSHFLLLAVLPVALLHGAWIAWMFWPLPSFFGNHPLVGLAVALVFLIAYGMLIRLCFGPLADRQTVTFNAAKTHVAVERLWFGKFKISNVIPFREIEKFEISPPENRGFCRIHLVDGQTQLLFKIGKTDDFAPVQHLEEITRKKTELVM
jgi:hypothetical protein